MKTAYRYAVGNVRNSVSTLSRQTRTTCNFAFNRPIHILNHLVELFSFDETKEIGKRQAVKEKEKYCICVFTLRRQSNIFPLSYRAYF